MPRDLVPELHDVGKLLDREALNQTLGIGLQGHCFEGIDFVHLDKEEPRTATWQGVKHHHDDKWDRLPQATDLVDPTERESRWQVFLLKLADHLAASVARAVYETGDRGQRATHVHRLWNPQYYRRFPSDLAISDLTRLKELIDFLRTDPDKGQFFRRYGAQLDFLPEDRSAPRNVTTLQTHLELVGKIFRVLMRSTTLHEENGRLVGRYGSDLAGSIFDAEGPRPFKDPGSGRWAFRLLKARFSFPHSISRLQDLNILGLRSELLGGLVAGQPDNVLLTTPDSALLLLARDDDPQKIFQDFLDKGFYVEATEILADLGLLNSDLDDKYRFESFNNYYREKPQRELASLQKERDALQRDVESLKAERDKIDESLQAPSADRETLGKQRRDLSRSLDDKERELSRIDQQCTLRQNMPARYRVTQTAWHATPHSQRFSELCPVCQMNPCDAEPWVKGKFVDPLCPLCKKVRERRDPDPGSRYARWDELDVRVGWVKLSLHTGQRGSAVRNLFKDYVHNHAMLQPLDADKRDELVQNFRPLAVEVDFTNDYLELLRDFRQRLCQGGTNLPDSIIQPIPDYNELYIFQVPDSTSLFLLLQTFLDSLQDFFPIYVGEKASPDCPIHFAVSLSDTKFPFNAHWRQVSRTARAINIFQPARAIRLELDVPRYLLLKRVLYDQATTASSSFLHRLSALVGAGTVLAAEVEMIENRSKYPDIFELYRTQLATISEILDFYRLTVD